MRRLGLSSGEKEKEKRRREEKKRKIIRKKEEEKKKKIQVWNACLEFMFGISLLFGKILLEMLLVGIR